ncbi:hypothetical protein E2542_SST01262 [Spatholobus suberectus]|nr:hypothetical protein E2542_SST01262 [Spatholobus suberectus]
MDSSQLNASIVNASRNKRINERDWRKNLVGSGGLWLSHWSWRWRRRASANKRKELGRWATSCGGGAGWAMSHEGGVGEVGRELRRGVGEVGCGGGDGAKNRKERGSRGGGRRAEREIDCRREKINLSLIL